MITERQVEQIIERLINRVEKTNAMFLKSIGYSLKELKNLTPSKAQQLIQILKYGGKYEDIIKEMSKITDLNIADIDDIFNNYAKKDQLFYEKFYKYRDVPFTPFEDNLILKRQTQALANMVKNEMYNFTRNNVLGYTIDGQFYNLRDTYNQLLDTAFMNISQGKETFDQAMTNIIKDIGGSGLKTLNYESGRNIRLDSAIRMQLDSRLSELHYENQKIIGDEIQADGVEITVHLNPAPDHADIQGRQFSIDHYDNDGNFISGEYEKLQNGETAKDYKGNNYTLDKNDRGSYRPIREMNCKHKEFTIVLGVDKPQYSDEQLKQIKEDNNKGFDFDGKHYTNYEGTQLQRELERKIREQKDTQILAKASDNKELIAGSQTKITQLTRKYKELSKTSGLPTKMDRLRVSGYKRKKVS